MTRRLVIPALALVLAACSVSEAPLVASDVEITRPVPGVDLSSGYLSLTNTTTQPIRITRVSSPEFATVAMHESALEDGMARMYPLAELMILPRQTVQFARGGKHLMLRSPVSTPDTVTLQFYAGSALILSVSAPVGDR